MGSTTKRSLLFATTEVPFPATSGGRIKSYRLIKFLAQHFEVRLVCAHALDPEIDLNGLRLELGVSSIQVFDTFKKRNPWNWFLAFMQFPTWSTFRVYSKKLESMLKWGVEGADVVVMDHLDLIEMLPENLVSKVHYHSHNAEHKLWRDYASLESNPIKKSLLSLEADRIKNFESWVVRKAKNTFAAPNDEKLLMEVSGADKSKFSPTYHLGDEAALAMPEIDLINNEPRIFYAGTLSWIPNRDGLIWFLNECWPIVKKAHPKAELTICGSGADQTLLDVMKHSVGVNYRGFVGDLEPILSSSVLAIIPLRFGSGMKIKTFEAMYRGLPFVTTSQGAESIDLIDGIHCKINDDPSGFARSILELLDDRKKGLALAQNSRKLAKERYTYPIIFEQMLAKLS